MKLILLAVISALAFPMAALAAQPSEQGSPARSASERASKGQQTFAVPATELMGRDVKNRRGQDVGEIQELIIDLGNNRVHYAVLGARNKVFAYPMRGFQPVAGKDHLLLNASDERLERAPGMNKDEWGRTGLWSQDYQRDIEAYWESDRPERTAETRGRASAEAKSAQGQQVGVEPRARLVRATNLIGHNLETAQGEGMGELIELVVEVGGGRVLFGLVDFDDNVGKHIAPDDKLHPIPVSALAFTQGRDRLTLNVDRKHLRPERTIDPMRLERKLESRSFVQNTTQYAMGLASKRGATGRAVERGQ